MATDTSTAAATAEAPAAGRRRLPPELSILGVMIGMMLLFEVLGWIFVGQSFIANPLRLKIMILQEAEIGIIAVGVTQIIIMGGIDLSSGLGRRHDGDDRGEPRPGRRLQPRRSIPSLTGLNPIFPGGGGPALRPARRRSSTAALIAYTKIPPFIATLGMMVSARGVADWYTNGQPIGNLERLLRRDRLRLVAGHHLPRRRLHLPYRAALHALRQVHLRDRRQSARGARLGHQRRAPHRARLHARRGCSRACRGIVHTARAISGQAGVGVGFELDAIAAAVIGGTSLSGGVGRMTGTVIGAVILGILTSGFTFLNVDAHYQEIIKGGVIIAAVVADQYRQRRRKGA